MEDGKRFSDCGFTLQWLVVADLLGLKVSHFEGFHLLLPDLLQKAGHVPLRSARPSRAVPRPGKDRTTWRNNLAIFIVCDSWR